jgi:hypothetical protein
MKRGFKIIILCHGKGQGLFQRVGYCMMVLADNLSLLLSLVAQGADEEPQFYFLLQKGRGADN